MKIGQIQYAPAFRLRLRVHGHGPFQCLDPFERLGYSVWSIVD